MTKPGEFVKITGIAPSEFDISDFLDRMRYAATVGNYVKKPKVNYVPYVGTAYFPERIDINKKKMIVHVKWKDGTETKVKLMEGDVWDEYDAFCICLAKRIYGSNSYLKRTIDSVVHYTDEKKKNK